MYMDETLKKKFCFAYLNKFGVLSDLHKVC